MQATKDSFYVTLRDRLAQAYPARTVTIDGTTRPAVLVAENEKPSITRRADEAFYLEWGEARAVRPATSTLMAMTCTFTYTSAGTEQNGGVDRGRLLGELDTELLAICSPAAAEKNDWTGVNQVDLGSTIFWGALIIRPKAAEAGHAAHEASVTVYFYPEVNQS